MKRLKGCWEGERQEAGDQPCGHGSHRRKAVTELKAMLSMLISLSLSLFFFTTDCPSPENWKMEGFKIAIQMLYVLMYFHFLTFYRENEEDKEMADFLKSKFPRNMKKTGI